MKTKPKKPEIERLERLLAEKNDIIRHLRREIASLQDKIREVIAELS